ncbi:MAG TPA: long-chain fatty acid--CoA ligase [Thermoanaerobaculia bacterium]|nr:long-chain fatty acid--CoA ligase [Thermoanaerobaculia bacterium]HQR66644.1 long-chain fatty acid--CoA ligase [Thermoanaerobaculia bacterium]
MEPRTLVDIFRNLQNFQKPDLLLVKKDGAWRPVSTKEFIDRVRAISSALEGLGVKPGDRVALLSENRPEWAIVDFACQCYGAVLVPIFPTMVSEQTEYLLRDSGSVVAFCSNADQATKVLDAKGACPGLRHVVIFDEVVLKGTRPFDEVLVEGRKAYAADPAAFERRADARKPDDLATLIYTSGTTGEPKGAMLMQSNFVSNVLACAGLLPLPPTTVGLSFLPLSHVLERMCEYLYYHFGVTIAYAESIEKLKDNLGEVNPHIFAAVPRVYEKVYGRIMDNVSKAPAARQKLFWKALDVGRQVHALRAQKKAPDVILALQHFVFDRLVFGKIRAALGSRFRYSISGGAPLSKELAEFFWTAGVEVFEGYGLTETSPVIAVNYPGAWRLGTVGRILPGVECRIAADGEILTRGPHVMKGYFNKPEATKEAIDADGWFHTGDIGRIDEDGFLAITDRKKELIVNANGKNIAPAPIEGFLKGNAFISLPIIIGDRRRFLVCLIVPNFEKLKEWASQHGLGSLSPESLVKEPRVRDIYQKAMDEWNAGKSHEQQIVRFGLLTSDLTIEGGELTPTLKVKRRIIDQKYRALIDELYEEKAG